MQITELIAQWRAVIRQRKELDDLSKKLKEGPEAQLKAQILTYLDTAGINGTKTDAGTATKTYKNHVEITDMERFLTYQLTMLKECNTQQRPLSDGLILQKTPLKSGIVDIVMRSLGKDPDADSVTDEEFNAAAADMGIRRVSYADLHFKSV